MKLKYKERRGINPSPFGESDSSRKVMRGHSIKSIGLWDYEEVREKLLRGDLEFVSGGVSYGIRPDLMKRYAVFLKDPYCKGCGLRINYAILHIDMDNPNDKYREAYLRFYGYNGRLMTVDHIIPKSQGGTNDPDNLQTMCVKCNMWKKDDLSWRYYMSIKVRNWRLKHPEWYATEVVEGLAK